MRRHVPHAQAAGPRDDWSAWAAPSDTSVLAVPVRDGTRLTVHFDGPFDPTIRLDDTLVRPSSDAPLAVRARRYVARHLQALDAVLGQSLALVWRVTDAGLLLRDVVRLADGAAFSAGAVRTCVAPLGLSGISGAVELGPVRGKRAVLRALDVHFAPGTPVELRAGHDDIVTARRRVVVPR